MNKMKFIGLIAMVFACTGALAMQDQSSVFEMNESGVALFDDGDSGFEMHEIGAASLVSNSVFETYEASVALFDDSDSATTLSCDNNIGARSYSQRVHAAGISHCISVIHRAMQRITNEKTNGDTT